MMSDTKRSICGKIARFLSLTASLISLIALSPLFLAVGLCIKLDSHGPVFFIQEAVGKNGKGFMFYKFRSMFHQSDNRRHREYTTRFVTQKESAYRSGDGKAPPIFKMDDDPRITRVGKILRRFSIDELPQLINVLKGDMAFVGPRPPLPYEVVHYNHWHRQRLSVPPGMTGLYQVTARNRAPFDEMVKLDIQYIQHKSLWFDLVIILKTLPALVYRKGL